MQVRRFQDLLAHYDRGERDFSGSELDEDPNHDLSGCRLDAVDLSRSFIVASFRGAMLRGAMFRYANVKTCDFTAADLRDADFRDAAIDAAEFKDARLEGARFEGASAFGYRLAPGETPNR